MGKAAGEVYVERLRDEVALEVLKILLEHDIYQEGQRVITRERSKQMCNSAFTMADEFVISRQAGRT